MKQKIVAFGDDFMIKDEHGNKRFFVDGFAFSFGHKLSFQDMQGNQLAMIKQKLFAFRKTFVITSKGQQLAIIYKKLMSFRPCFFIDVPGPNDINVTGKLIEHEYVFKRNGNEIARSSRKFFRTSDTYGIDIADERDAVLILACAICIDLCCHNPKSKHHR